MRIKFFWLFGILAACSFTPSPWIADSIAAGDRSFDTSRLRYASSQIHPPLAFEMLRTGGQIEAYLSLNRFRLPSIEPVKVFFTVEDQSFEEEILVHEGGMRLRLSSETTQWLIETLQDGHKIGILLDDFEETLDPGQFSRSFAKFLEEGYFFQNLLRGPNQ